MPVDDFAACEAGRVHEPVTVRDERSRTRLHRGEIARRIVVDLGDRRAGEDVVELLEEQQLPEAVELRPRILAAVCHREELGVVERLLAAAVAALHSACEV